MGRVLHVLLFTVCMLTCEGVCGVTVCMLVCEGVCGVTVCMLVCSLTTAM